MKGKATVRKKPPGQKRKTTRDRSDLLRKDIWILFFELDEARNWLLRIEDRLLNTVTRWHHIKLKKDRDFKELQRALVRTGAASEELLKASQVAEDLENGRRA